MQTAQERILKHLEGIVRGLGLECSLSPNLSNTGVVLIHDGKTPMAFASVQYNFQATDYTLDITVDGAKLAPTDGAGDRTAFLQSYQEDTEVWTMLQQALEKSGRTTRQHNEYALLEQNGFCVKSTGPTKTAWIKDLPDGSIAVTDQSGETHNLGHEKNALIARYDLTNKPVGAGRPATGLAQIIKTANSLHKSSKRAAAA